MITKFVEVTNDEQNWGKFLVMKFDTEWEYRSCMTPESKRPLLDACGWSRDHIWVLDLQTGEGVFVRLGGFAAADLNKHKVWVCPMFEPFLEWLYKQNMNELEKLPDRLNLPDAPFSMSGYRREGK